MQIIPVIDVSSGHAVAASGNVQRAQYRPVEVPWCVGSLPSDLVRAIRLRYPIETIYVADLDAIEGRRPASDWVKDLDGEGPIWLDCGIRDASDMSERRLPEWVTPVVGLETLRGPSALHEVVAASHAGRVVFSLDLREGRPLTAIDSHWPGEPVGIARAAVQAGLSQLLILDLGRVGRLGGVVDWAVPILADMQTAGVVASWFVGGGLGHVEEIDRLCRAGFSGVLVGSALLGGRLDGVLSAGSTRQVEPDRLADSPRDE